MREDEVCRELLLAAREVSGAKSPFTVIRPLSLKKEPRGTNVSIENAEKIKAAGYSLIGGSVKYDLGSNVYCEVKADFYRDIDGSSGEWSFFGFFFGYGGQGPRGFKDFLDMFGWGGKDSKIFERGNFLKNLKESGTINLTSFT